MTDSNAWENSPTTGKTKESHPIISICVILAVVIIGLADFTDALERLLKYFPTWGNHITLEDLPGDTGWLLVGDLDTKNGVYVRGPLFRVVKSIYKDESILPRKGEWIKLLATRNVVILDYFKRAKPNHPSNLGSEVSFKSIQSQKCDNRLEA